MRRVGKTLNYGVVYGMTGYRLALEAGIDRKEATRFVRRHREQYPAVRAYVERTLREAEAKGYVETPLGRRRYLPDIGAKNRQRRRQHGAPQRTCRTRAWSRRSSSWR